MKSAMIPKMKILQMREEGHKFHLLATGTKKPMYPNWQNSDPDEQTLRTWINQDSDIGWIQTLTAALDFDDIVKARAWYRKIGYQLTFALARTPRGIHAVFNNPGHIGNAVNVNGLYDIRGNGGYLKYYGFVEGFETTDPEKLDTFRDEWLPVKQPVVSKVITDVSAYISKIMSIQGENGSKDLMRAVAKCKDGGLTQSQAMVTILEWNKSNARPIWSTVELCRAVTRIYEVYK